jgi:hypothetical protein
MFYILEFLISLLTVNQPYDNSIKFLAQSLLCLPASEGIWDVGLNPAFDIYIFTEE